MRQKLRLVKRPFRSRSKQCDIVPEIIDLGRMCITDLYQNKYCKRRKIDACHTNWWPGNNKGYGNTGCGVFKWGIQNWISVLKLKFLARVLAKALKMFFFPFPVYLSFIYLFPSYISSLIVLIYHAKVVNLIFITIIISNHFFQFINS